MGAGRVGVRWTIGDVAADGFEALRLSVWGAWRVFGPAARYVVCLNSLSLGEARRRTGELPSGVTWRDVTGELPAFMRNHLDGGMAEGVGWKFAPLRVFPDGHELALDNDCILWELPPAMADWLDDADARSFLIAEDVRTCLGRFASLCGPEPRNSGIRGLPPGFDLERALRATLDVIPGPLQSELDEQGLQVAALYRAGAVHVVSVEDVSICSPLPPHIPWLGRSGAHFVGLNARRLSFVFAGKPADALVRQHWRQLRPELYERVGVVSVAADAPEPEVA